jgi:MinD superfamily P-loop ATPase
VLGGAEHGAHCLVEQLLAPPNRRWYPVIDYSRCTNCLECLDFCLFGVYGVDAARKLQVQNQDNCKTNCPACSRVCPEAAIMFPKYHAGPIDGAPVSQTDVGREKMKIDISALLGGDLYARLRERSAEAKVPSSIWMRLWAMVPGMTLAAVSP